MLDMKPIDELPRSVELFKKISDLERKRNNITDQIEECEYELEKNLAPELLECYADYVRIIYKHFGDAGRMLTAIEQGKEPFIEGKFSDSTDSKSTEAS